METLSNDCKNVGRLKAVEKQLHSVRRKKNASLFLRVSRSFLRIFPGIVVVSTLTFAKTVGGHTKGTRALLERSKTPLKKKTAGEHDACPPKSHEAKKAHKL